IRRTAMPQLTAFLPSKIGDLPDDTVTSTLVVVGKKESGKSYFMGVVEEEFAKQQTPFTVIDPVGAHWGIKTKYPVVVFGGPHADTPIDSTIGAEVADITVSSGMSNILDIKDFSRTAQRHFVKDFCESLYQKNRTPRHLFIEEANLFLPQRLSGDVAPVYTEVDNIVRLGRQNGIGVTIASQRPALLNKDSTSQGDGFFFFRMPAPQDRKAASEFLEGELAGDELKRFGAQLPKLKTGHCLVYSPEWLKCSGVELTVRQRETYHAGRTPKLGEKVDFKPVPVDVSEVATRLQEIIDSKSEEHDQLTMLTKEKHQLEETVEKLNERLKIRSEIQDVMGHKTLPTTFVLPDIEKKYADQIATLGHELEQSNHQLAEARKQLTELEPYLNFKLALDSILTKGQLVPVVDPEKPEWATIWLTKLPTAPRKILQFLIEHPKQTFTRQQLAQLTGYAFGGTYTTAMGVLSRNRLIRYTKEGVRLA
ncbi:MAG TPA: hypothetical protein VFV92_05585, partial [Candidatus Bathyarchaeia archaeon]|nr:hypothetical protein [Candidatus Bathyarchaeia archaeon]